MALLSHEVTMATATLGATSVFRKAFIVLSPLIAALFGGRAHAADAEAPEPWRVASLRQEADALVPLVRTGWVKEFLRGTVSLPSIPTRTLLHDAGRTHYYSEAEAAKLSDLERSALQALEIDEEYYYNT